MQRCQECSLNTWALGLCSTLHWVMPIFTSGSAPEAMAALRYLHLLYIWPLDTMCTLLYMRALSRAAGIPPITMTTKMARVLWRSVLVERNRPNLHRGGVHRLLPPREGLIDKSKSVLYHSLGHLLPIRGERRFCIG